MSTHQDTEKLSPYHVKIGKTWRESPNCWRETFTNGHWEYEMSIVFFTFVFLLINFLAKRFAKWYGHPLDIRPTLVASGGHGAYTCVASITILALGPEYYWIWQQIVIASSIGYFFHDIIIYCIPQKDILITFHHLVMIWCHYPCGEEVGAFWGGAGDPQWTVWMSMMGYTSEFAVVLLGYRWWLLQTLEKHTTTFSVVGYAVVASFIVRCLVMGYLLVFQVFRRFDDFMYYQQKFAYAFLVSGHIIIFFLSGHWLQTILAGGWSNYITFRKRPKNKGAFQFTANFMGAGNAVSDTSDASASDNDHANDQQSKKPQNNAKLVKKND